MIRVNVTYDDNNVYKMIIKGHAGFADAGKDIVCAAISAIAFGGANALDCYGANIKITDNKIEFEDPTGDAKDVMFTLLTQFKTVSESFPQYIQIQEG